MNIAGLPSRSRQPPCVVGRPIKRKYQAGKSIAQRIINSTEQRAAMIIGDAVAAFKPMSQHGRVPITMSCHHSQMISLEMDICGSLIHIGKQVHRAGIAFKTAAARRRREVRAALAGEICASEMRTCLDNALPPRHENDDE